MSRPTLEVADIVRAAGNSFWERQQSHLAWPHRKVLDAIVRCRTAALGGHRDQCVSCGHQAISYNSCRNRHCPKCQASARAKWLAQRQTELLPVPYFHVALAEPQTDLHHLVPCRFADALGNRRGSQASGRFHRLPRRAAHLGSESASPSPPALCRAGRRALSRRFPLDPLP